MNGIYHFFFLMIDFRVLLFQISADPHEDFRLAERDVSEHCPDLARVRFHFPVRHRMPEDDVNAAAALYQRAHSRNDEPA